MEQQQQEVAPGMLQQQQQHEDDVATGMEQQQQQMQEVTAGMEQQLQVAPGMQEDEEVASVMEQQQQQLQEVAAGMEQQQLQVVPGMQEDEEVASVMEKQQQLQEAAAGMEQQPLQVARGMQEYEEVAFAMEQLQQQLQEVAASIGQQQLQVEPGMQEDEEVACIMEQLHQLLHEVAVGMEQQLQVVPEIVQEDEEMAYVMEQLQQLLQEEAVGMEQQQLQVASGMQEDEEVASVMEQQQQEEEEVGVPDSRSPSPPPIPPRPVLLPSPPQSPPPVPEPPAELQDVATTTLAVALDDLQQNDVKQEYAPDMDPDTPELGIPATGDGNITSSSGIDEPQQTTECQDGNCSRKSEGSEESDDECTEYSDYSDFDYRDIIGVVVKICSEKTYDDSKTKSEEPTKSDTAETQDRQHAHSNVKKVPEKDSCADGTTEEPERENLLHFMKDGCRIYMDETWKLYKRIKDLRVVALVLRNGDLEEKSKETLILESTSTDTTAQLSQSASAPSPTADTDPKAKPPLSRVVCFPVEGVDPALVEAIVDRLNLKSMTVKRVSTSSLDSSSSSDSEYPIEFVRQGGASLPKGTEQQLPGRLPQKQMETSCNTQADRPCETVVSTSLPTETPGGTASARTPLDEVGRNRIAQSTATSVVTDKPYGKLQNQKLDPKKEAGVHPDEKWQNTGSSDTTSSVATAKPPHCIILSQSSSGNATGTTLQAVDAKGAAGQRAGSIVVKVATTNKTSAGMSFPIEHTIRFGSFTVDDPIFSVIRGRETQGSVTMPNEGEHQLPQQQMQRSNVFSTAAPRHPAPQPSYVLSTPPPFVQCVYSHPATQPHSAAIPVPSPIGTVFGNMNLQSGTVSPHLQQRMLNEQLQHHHVFAPMVPGPVPQRMVLLDTQHSVPYCHSAHTAGANQQTASVPGNPTAATLPAYEISVVSTYGGIPGTPRNQQGAQAHAFGPMPICTCCRRPQASHQWTVAQREYRAAPQNDQQADNAPGASSQQGRTPARK